MFEDTIQRKLEVAASCASVSKSDELESSREDEGGPVSGPETPSGASKVVGTSQFVQRVYDDSSDSQKLDPSDLTDLIIRESTYPKASGGFADIYRGVLRQNENSVTVAIKVIKTYSDEDKVSEKKKQKRLRREMKVWFNLQHANILPFLGTTAGFGKYHAMVCPWVENGTLTSYLKAHFASLSKIVIVTLLDNVACGLHYLHSCSIVHGDLSGSNILIREDGGAYISDSGLSILLTELDGSTFATSFQAKGALRWAAPELLDLKVPEDGMGDDESPNGGPTTHSDVYSFGGVTLQILSGKVPYYYFRRDVQIVHAISKGIVPRRPRSDVVTNGQWAFIERCWAIVDEPQRRPSSKEIVEFTKQECARIIACPPQDERELSPVALTACRWTSQGSQDICGSFVQVAEFSDHIRNYHGIGGLEKSQVECSWEGCSAIMKKESLIRHIQEKHLELKHAVCPFCFERFSRSHTLHAHVRKKHAGMEAGP